MSDFVHLHCHFYSHDSVGVFTDIANRIREMGFDALACTDHGTLSGIVQFVNTCKRVGIKPIIGNEIYLSLHNDNEIYHLTILAQNEIGYKNLVKLNNIAKFRGSKVSKKRNSHVIHFNELLEHNEGLIVLSGCPNSPMQVLPYEDALTIAAELKNVFQDRFYIEAMCLNSDAHLIRAQKLAEDLQIKHVITNDSHYFRPEHYEIHQAYLKIVQGFSYDSSFNFLATKNEILERVRKIYPGYLKFVEDGISNTLEVADKTTPFSFDSEPKLPHIDNADEKLINSAIEGFLKLLKQNSLPIDENGLPARSYCERFSFELETILESNYSSYFLITKELIDSARNANFLIGIGRGSAAGSLVSWCLGITGIDPIKYNLLFERFINPERLELPDIDTDIPSLARESVIRYANETYGALQIAAYDRWGLRSILMKFAKYFALDEKLVKLANEGAEPVASKSKDEYLEDENYLALAATNEKFDLLVRTINGQIKNISRHAGGVVILDGVENIPFETAPDGTLIVAYSEGVNSKDLASVGGVKFDLLGLSGLDILQFLKEKIGIEPPEPTDDDPVFELFRTGKTSGIFQFNGVGNIEFTKQIAPRTFEDLIAINALYRKGTLVGGTAEHYLETRKSGLARKIHPEVDEILKATYGCLVYQEDIMKLYAWACNKSFGQADFARKALTKFKAGVPEKEALKLKLEKEMREGMTKKGLPKQTQDMLWHEMVAHSLYSFNRSHAAAYAMIAWKMAWYKFHYPLHFAAAGLNFRSEDEKQEFIFEIVSEGYEIALPDINVSTLEYTVSDDGKTLYMPLNSIHGIGDKAASVIIEKRPFLSYLEVVTKCPRRPVTKGVLKALYQVGAMRFDDDYKVLKLDEEDYTLLKRWQVQKIYFKKTQIPTPEIMAKINTANKLKNRIGGCVLSKEMKVNKKGQNYWRYYLTPSKIVNSDRDILEEGDWFRSEITDWGRIKEIEKLRG